MGGEAAHREFVIKVTHPKAMKSSRFFVAHKDECLVLSLDVTNKFEGTFLSQSLLDPY